MKANNVLVQLTDHKSKTKIYGYYLDKFKFTIPDIDIQIKIWDFDFASVDGYIENNKVNSAWANKINVTKIENKYYDMHYFFNTLISKRFFKEFYDGGAPKEIVEFIHRVIPEEFRHGGKYVNKKGRIQINNEYLTPYKVLVEDPLFDEYRKIDSSRIKPKK